MKHVSIQKSVCDEAAIVVVTQDTHTHRIECVGRFALQPVAITTASSSASSVCKCDLSFTGRSPQEHRDAPERKRSSQTRLIKPTDGLQTEHPNTILQWEQTHTQNTKSSRINWMDCEMQTLLKSFFFKSSHCVTFYMAFIRPNPPTI